MNEVWKPVNGYEGLYEISSLGRVKSLPRTVDNGFNVRHTKEKILRKSYFANGYEKALLTMNGKSKCFRVHRLVAIAFIDNPNGFKEVNHINEDKTDNRVENLEWCDRLYNCNYGTRNEKVGLYQKKAVVQLSLSGDIIREFPSATDAEKHLGKRGNHIASCCTGNRGSAYGYKWRYADAR